MLAAVLYAGFVGSVTAVLTSYTSTASAYRDSLSKLRSFAVSHGLTRSTTAEIVSYFDAYWVELKGFDREHMLRQLPPHLRPKVLLELHASLLKACDFLHELSSVGCVDFLRRLRVEVCDAGDTLIHARTFQHQFYILMRGELQLSVLDSTDPGLASHRVHREGSGGGGDGGGGGGGDDGGDGGGDDCVSTMVLMPSVPLTPVRCALSAAFDPSPMQLVQ